MKAKAVIVFEDFEAVKELLAEKLRGKQVRVFTSFEAGIEYADEFDHKVTTEKEVVVISSPASRKKSPSNKMLEIVLQGVYPNPTVYFDGETPLKVSFCHDSVTVTNQTGQYIRLVIVG